MDSTVSAFLSLLEVDICAARLGVLPDELACSMLASCSCAVNLDDDIEGEVAL